MYSVSKIQCFEQCPLKFKLKYIDKVEVERSNALKRGSNVHAIFENLGKTGGTPANPEELSVVEKFLGSEVGKELLPVILKAQKEVRIGLKKAEGGLEPCEYSSKALFGGIIDLLYNNRILDYKTGKAKSYNEQDWTQLTWYAIWLFLKTDYESIDISYIYVEHNVINTKTLYRKDLKELIESMLRRFVALKKFTDNPTQEHRVSWLCDYCDCKAHCPFHVDNALKTLNKVEF